MCDHPSPATYSRLICYTWLRFSSLSKLYFFTINYQMKYEEYMRIWEWALLSWILQGFKQMPFSQSVFGTQNRVVGCYRVYVHVTALDTSELTGDLSVSTPPPHTRLLLAREPPRQPPPLTRSPNTPTPESAVAPRTSLCDHGSTCISCAHATHH